ncbi:MAG: hypothetical protein HQL37_09220 [Alphaproteobacteria bacterium]|nr:hypothetical protein [Alphaproteobacteria bacterium]
MKKIIIVGQEAGGVGKSLLVTFLAEMHRANGQDFIILDADDKNRTAAGGSALAHALPHHQVVWLGTGPRMAELEANPDAGKAHWDKVREVLNNSSVILDLGANTVQKLLEYAVSMRVAKRWSEDGISVEFLVPLTNDKINIESGLKALNAAGKAFGGPALRAVRNLRDGPFSGWAGTPLGAALDGLHTAGVVVADLPKAPIPAAGLEAMKRGPWSPFQVVGMGLAGVAGQLALPDLVAERTLYGCEDWVTAVRESLGDLVPRGN